jgi:thiol-disulfide isomerase/thioredoxin
MRRNVVLLALALCCVAAAARPYAGQEEKKAGGERAKLLAVGEAAPGWKLVDPEGKAHTLSDYRGRVVVLDFWATWCGPCAKVMPRLEKLQKKYADRGVVVLGLSSWDTGDPAAAMKKRGITYTLLLKGEEMAPSYGVTSLPVVYVIGADGRVVYSHAGPDQKDLSDLIENQLK